MSTLKQTLTSLLPFRYVLYCFCNFYAFKKRQTLSSLVFKVCSDLTTLSFAIFTNPSILLLILGSKNVVSVTLKTLYSKVQQMHWD